MEKHRAAIDVLNVKKAEQGKLTKQQAAELEKEKQALRDSRTALGQAAAEEKKALEAKNAHQKGIDATRVALAKQREALELVSQSLRQAGVPPLLLWKEDQDRHLHRDPPVQSALLLLL